MPVAVAVPCNPCVRILQVIVFPSASVAFSVRLKAVGVSSSDMVTPTGSISVNTGASFYALMVIFTVMLSVPPLPSETCTTKLSEPW